MDIINILDAILMSAKSWSEVEESTIARSWSKLLSLPDVPEREASDTSLQIDMVMDELHVPAEERSDWLTLDKNDPGYHEYTDEELFLIRKLVRHWKQFLYIWSSNQKYQ